MNIPLSVLDLSPLVSAAGASEAYRNTIALAQLADRLGCTRFWLAEHHNMPGIASVAPELLIGPVASATQRIRVGAGGIMLPNHSSLKVVETFKVLEALHPGRIDLGLRRAPGTDGRTAMALRRSPLAQGGDDFPEQLQELQYFDTDSFPPNHPLRSIRAVPVEVRLPPIWLLGSSDFSARLAAQQGLGFAFAHHIGPHAAVEAMRLYRLGFKPSPTLQAPHAILTVSVVCAPTDEDADRIARMVDLAWVRFLRRQSGPLPTMEEAQAYRFSADELDAIRDRRKSLFVGSPTTLSAALAPLIRDTQADELMVTMLLHQPARLTALELLAQACGLTASVPGQGRQ